MRNGLWLAGVLSGIGLLLMSATFLTPSASQAVVASATVHYVDSAGNCGGHTPCYATIQAAADAASGGATILVAEGSYTGVTTRNGHTQVLYIGKVLTIRGGYTTTFADPPDPDAHRAILDAQQQGVVVYIGQAREVMLDGFRLVGGNATDAVSGLDTGGGLRVDSSSNNWVQVQNCWIGENSATAGGAGGIAVDFANFALTNSTVVSNTGTGVILFSSHSPQLVGNTVANNSAGGVTLLSSRYGDGILIRNNTFRDNSGNGIYLGTIESDGDIDLIAGNTFVGNSRGLFGKFIYDTLHIESNTFLSNTNNSAHDYDAHGGGIRLELAEAAVVNNVFAGNHARLFGGGLSVGNAEWGDVVVQSNRFHANTADWGGAVALDSGGTALVDGNWMGDNQARWGGGVAAADLVQLTLQRNIIAGNQATRFGGGFECESCSVILDANRLTDNSAGAEGGAIYITGNTLMPLPAPILTNNLVAGNSAPSGSGAMLCSRIVAMQHNTLAANRGGAGIQVKVLSLPASVSMTNTILVSHTVGVQVAAGSAALEGTLWGAGDWANGGDWSGNVTTGTVNLWDDPLFVDAIQGDYHISAGSPARDAGVASSVSPDIDGEMRPHPDTGLPDIGADEYHLDDPRTYLPLVSR